MSLRKRRYRGLALALVALSAMLVTPAEAGWPRRRRVVVQPYAVSPATPATIYARPRPTVAPTVTTTPARPVRSGFGSHFNPAYGLGPGYFATPPGPYFPE
jgi:hypothetical protein